LEAFDQLDLVAEIAIALLGFVAIFLALSRADGRFAESDRHFIQALVLGSALAIILALAPRSIILFVTDASVWYAATILEQAGVFLQTCGWRNRTWAQWIHWPHFSVDAR
jgi:hypothetical protein